MKRIFQRFQGLSIRHQLIAGIAFIYALLMTLLMIDLVAGQSDFLHRRAMADAGRMAETLAAGSASWVMAHDVVGLQEVVRSVARDPDVRYAMLLSPDGRVLAHSDPGNIGHFIKDATSRALLAGLPVPTTLVDDNDLVDVAAPVMAGKYFIGWARVGVGQERIAANLRQVKLKGVVFTLFAIALGSLFAIFMANSLTRGLNRLVSATSRVRGGERGFRVSFKRKDEIGRVGEDFNLMLAALEESESERKQATEAHRASEERFRDIALTSADWLWEVNAEGRYTFASDNVLNVLGYRAEEIIGKTPFDLMSPEEAERVMPLFQEIVARQVPFRLLENVNRHKDGTTRVILTSGVPVFDAQGQLCGFRGAEQDVTERRRAEEAARAAQAETAHLLAISDQSRLVLLSMIEDRKAADAEIRKLNTSLEQRVRDRTAELEAANKELETFSYSVSHDLRAPLRAVSGFAQILARSHGDSLNEEGRHYLDNVIAASERMGTLIDDLLHYSRTGRGAVRAVPVPLEPLAAHLASTFGERIAASGAHFEVIGPLATPLGDATLIGQILTNLVDNALTYRCRDGMPQVTLSAVREGEWVVLRVADNGIGIA
ncbi:MAG: PAS domain S-box protein, partial [Sulfuricella sp.]